MTAQGFGINKQRRDVLDRLITQLCGAAVCWAHEPRPQIDPVAKALITLRLRTTVSVSEWDAITIDQSSTASYAAGRTLTQLGAQRTHDIEMVVESYDPNVHAHEIYYTLTTRIYRDRFRAILNAVNISVGTNTDATDLTTEYDGHIYSTCAGILKLTACDLDLVTDDFDTYIETVNGNNLVSGTVTGI